jgi:hypothetical protein
VSVSAVLLNELERAPNDSLRATHFPITRAYRSTRRYRLVEMARWIVICSRRRSRTPVAEFIALSSPQGKRPEAASVSTTAARQLAHADGKIDLSTPFTIAVGAATNLCWKISSPRTMTAYRGGQTISTMGGKPRPNGSRS